MRYLSLLLMLLASPALAQCPGGVCPVPQRYTPAITYSIVKQTAPVITKVPVQRVIDCPNGSCPVQTIKTTMYYSPRWRYTGNLPTLEHIYRHHNISRSTPPGEAYRKHDAWHDRYGGAAPQSRTRFFRR